jgi:peroxiredoxin
MPFASGVPAPWFSGRTGSNTSFNFSTVAGRYVVMCFFGSADSDDHRRILGEFLAQAGRFDDTDATFFGVSIDPDDEVLGRVTDREKGVRFFRDFDRSISRLYGALPQSDSAEQSVNDALIEYRPFTLVLDERLRVLAHFDFSFQSDMHVARVLQLLDAQPKFAPATPAAIQAPVLIVPRVFETDLCGKLIQLYNQHGGEDSGFMRDVNGQTVGIVDYGHKRRSDYTIEDEEVRTLCMHRIHDRLIPEIEKAFQFKATRMERYIVACYEGTDGGHFRAHRDNTTKGTAHRRFAVSLNLNAEDYEGGDLRFPEYGSHLYRPPTGGACVFSCSLLHAATPVTSGARYVFLPFLYDDAAARIRDENQQYLSTGATNPERPTVPLP